MNILIAPDKYKGSLSAPAVCMAIAQGIKQIKPYATIKSLPLADGGEGFTEAFLLNSKARQVKIKVTDPLGRPISSAYFIDENQTAILEMAEASGLKYLAVNERNPMIANTLGFGQMIKNAAEQGVKSIVIGIGGSATNDAGCGMASLLGYNFFDTNGKLIEPYGGNLLEIVKITRPKDKFWENIEIKVACDVQNPLYGPNGAAHIYGAQKGANLEQIKMLDAGLKHISDIIQKDLGLSFAHVPGAGAAGGMGFGLMSFLNAELKSGIDLILDHQNFDQALYGVDLIFTGEGKIDNQTLAGKVINGVVARAKKENIPVVGVCGKLELNQLQINTLGLLSIVECAALAQNTEDSMANAAHYIELGVASFLRNYHK